MFFRGFYRFFFAGFLFLIFTFELFCQTGSEEKKLLLDESSPYFLQDIPLLQGLDSFNEKIEKVRSSGRQPLGLVLCGGSARAFAHIGVLKAMEENDIVPDFIVANSMGAIIGLLYAYGFSPKKIEETISKIELTQFFEPVLPSKGGVLNVRKFRAFVNDFLGGPKDISDCSIPIIVLAENLYDKRQIYYASGDFATIMTGAFSMPVYMEAVKSQLSDGTKVLLTDSGTIDIAGLKCAASFSDNLIISTAFYDTKLNYNSAIVILNRVMSIGKERVAISDLKKYKPLIIRNQVENYSFMAFDKSSEIIKAGYDSADSVVDQIKELPHSNKVDSERRMIADSCADECVKKVLSGGHMTMNEKYFGFKLWPEFASVDYSSFTLYEKNQLALFAFFDTDKIYSKAAISFPFDFKYFCADLYTKIEASSFFNMEVLASWDFSYEGAKPLNFYGGGILRLRPNFFLSFVKPFFLSGEVNMASDFSKVKEAFFTSGLEFSFGNDRDYFLYFKPYCFLSGPDFNSLSSGVGGALSSNLNFSSLTKKNERFSFGLSENASFRYAEASFGEDSPFTKFYENDFWRCKKIEGTGDLLFSNQAELYFVCLDPQISLIEVFILKQYKAGLFYDCALFNSFYQAAGIFFRSEFSLVGLCDFTLEVSYGWQLPQNKGAFSFAIKNRI